MANNQRSNALYRCACGLLYQRVSGSLRCSCGRLVPPAPMPNEVKHG